MQEEPLSGQQWIVQPQYHLIGEAGSRFIRGEGEVQRVDAWKLIQQTVNRHGRPNRKLEDTRLPAFMRFANIRSENDVLAFARDYGLLGLFGHRFPTPVWQDEKRTRLIGFVDRNGVFCPVDAAAGHLEKQTGRPVSAERLQAIMQYQTLTRIVSRVEPVHLWLQHANVLHQVLDEPSFVSSAEDALAWLLPRWNEESARHGLVGIRVSIQRVRSDSWQQEWQFSSLLDALWLQCAAWLTGNATIATCVECGNLYLVKDVRSDYCSDSCKRRRQNRRSFVRRLQKAGVGMEEIASRLHADVADVQAWLKGKEE